MPRPAILWSLALHAGVVVLVVQWVPSTTMPGDSGPPGVAVSFFLSDDASSLPLAATAPPEPPTPATSLVVTQVKPPTPSVMEVLPITANAPSQAQESPPRNARSGVASSAPNNASAESRAIRPRERKGSQRGSGGEVQGGSLSGAGGHAGGSGYQPPQFHVRYKPPYPSAARAEHLEGTVYLLVSIDPKGWVIRASIERSCGHLLLDQAALTAIRTWHFDPARQNGVAIAAQVEVPVRFRFAE